MNLRCPEHPEVASALLGVEVLEQEVWVYRVWRGDARACGLSISDGKKKKPSTLLREGLLLYLPQTVRRGRVFAPKVHQQKPLFVCVAHLLGQVMQTLVVLCLRDRAVFEEGFQGGHLPVVESPALFLWG